MQINRFNTATKMPTFSDERAKLKHAYQELLASQSYSHFIVIEPGHKFLPSLDEAIQRLRQIEFWLNRNYLKSSFPKWRLEERFWFTITKEGDAKTGGEHFHILLHAPERGYRRDLKWFHRMFPADFRFMWWLLAHPDRRLPLPQIGEQKIYVEEARDGAASAIYITKQLPLRMNTDALFFTHP